MLCERKFDDQPLFVDGFECPTLRLFAVSCTCELSKEVSVAQNNYLPTENISCKYYFYLLVSLLFAGIFTGEQA